MVLQVFTTEGLYPVGQFVVITISVASPLPLSFPTRET